MTVTQPSHVPLVAIFGNLAFDNEVYRREIKVVGGVSLLLEASY